MSTKYSYMSASTNSWPPKRPLSVHGALRGLSVAGEDCQRLAIRDVEANASASNVVWRGTTAPRRLESFEATCWKRRVATDFGNSAQPQLTTA